MISDILESKLAAVGFVRGETLFRGYIPPNVPIAVMIREPLGGIKINPYMAGHHKGKMQAIVRHVDPEEGVEMARLVWRTLDVRSREYHPATVDHGPVHLDQFIPETLPVQYPRLDGNTLEWSQSFNAVFGVKWS